MKTFIHIDIIANLLTHAIVGDLDPGVYHAVDSNPSVNEIVGRLRETVHNIEFNHVNQRQRMESLIMARDARLARYQVDVTGLPEALAAALSCMGCPVTNRSEATEAIERLNGVAND